MQFWRWSFLLLVALPALALALLGMRAVRAERVEREQQLRDRQAQTAQLADARIRAALLEIERELQRRDATNGATPIAGVHFFTFDRSGRLEFTDDRVYFADAPETIEWPAEVEDLVERARTAETQGRPREAAAAYARIAALEPRLRAWARKENRPDDDQLTPSGLPFALAAGKADALTRLRAGRWRLSFEERRFYDQELRRHVGNAAPDPRLQELAAIARFMSDVPLRRDEATRHFARSTLVVMSPSKQSATLWQGAALTPQWLDGMFKTLGLSHAPSGRGRAEALAAVPGWKIVFPQHATSWFDQRTLLWLAFIAVLIVTMLGSLAGTARVIRREAELARMQNDFIAGVSHEFKSPITGIGLLLERMAPGKYREAAERELTRLERHVNRLLEAQQIQAGERRYVFTPVSLSDIVADAVAEHATEADAKQINVESATNGLPAVAVDREAMTGAVSNLIGNAIKYSPAGSRVSVRTRSENSHAVIEVEDEGVGIDEADMGRIFRRFYRGRRTHHVNGTGLGLALVKATVQAHGGEVNVTRAPGKGSRFTITLPIREI